MMHSNLHIEKYGKVHTVETTSNALKSKSFNYKLSSTDVST